MLKKNIAERLKIIRDRMESACARVGRNAAEVKLIVVTKSTTIEGIEEVIRQGCTELAENRVQQLKKIAVSVDEFVSQLNTEGNTSRKVNWHMIGHLQRNKVKQVLPIISLVHSIDTLRLAEEIDEAAAKLNLKVNVLMQVNTSMEPQKYGIPIGAAIHLAEQIETLPNLQLIGLMTMAPLTRDKDLIRDCFVRARELFFEIKGEKIVGPHFTELSMGMSSDYEIAVEEGSTMLRIGSAIFSG